MNANQVISEMTGKMEHPSLYQAKPGEHIADLIALARVWPSTQAQAKRVADRGELGMLYNKDVEDLIEPLLNKHGLEGEYKLTRSGGCIRLVNFSDFKTALKLEYKF